MGKKEEEERAEKNSEILRKYLSNEARARKLEQKEFQLLTEPAYRRKFCKNLDHETNVKTKLKRMLKYHDNLDEIHDSFSEQEEQENPNSTLSASILNSYE